MTAEAVALGSRDIANAWVDALAAAGLAVTRSGKRATAQVSLAAPLPQGATSDWELIDLHLEEVVSPSEALCRIGRHLPEGIQAISVRGVGPGEPSLQAQLRWAEYEVAVPATVVREDVVSAIVQLRAADTFPMEHRREKKTKHYDLRPLVLNIHLGQSADAEEHRLVLRLRAEPERTARVDQTIAALGLPDPLRVHRTRLFADNTPSAVVAFRRASERVGG